MDEDILLCGDKVIGVGNYSEFFSMGKPEMKSVVRNNQDYRRLQISISRNEFISKLSKSVKTDYIEYEMKSYIEYINHMEIDDKILKIRKNMFQQYNSIDSWIKEAMNLYDKSLQTESVFGSIIWDDYVESYFNKAAITDKSIVQRYLLKEELDIMVDYENDDTYYNIPFLSGNEYLYLIISRMSDENIIIDVTHRHNEKIQKMQQRWIYKKNTPAWNRFQSQYNNSMKKIEKNSDEFQNELLVVYLIAIMESYIKQACILVINSDSVYMRKILENDKEFTKKKGKIEYSQILHEVQKLREDMTEYFTRESFQSEGRIKLYLFNIFELELKEDFLNIYHKILESRNMIIHYGGFYPDGKKLCISKEELIKWYEIIYDMIEKFDHKALFSVL